MKHQLQVGEFRILKENNRYFIQKYRKILFFKFWDYTFCDYESLEKAKARIKKFKRKNEKTEIKVVWEEGVNPLYPKPEATPPPRNPSA